MTQEGTNESSGLHLCPRVLVPPASRRPDIDGVMATDEWAEACVLGGMISFLEVRSASAQTRVFLMYDDAALYIAFHALRDNDQPLRANVSVDQGPIWQDDSVEISLDPGPTRAGSMLFLLNSIGRVCNARNGNLAWEADLSYQCRVMEDRWEGEAAIPWASLDAEPTKPGETWGFNFYRNHFTSLPCYTSAWAYSGGSNRAFDQLGYIVFGAAGGPVVRTDRWGQVAGSDVGWRGAIRSQHPLRLSHAAYRLVESTPGFPQMEHLEPLRSETIDLPHATGDALLTLCRSCETGTYVWSLSVHTTAGETVFAKSLPLCIDDPVEVRIMPYPLMTKRLDIEIDTTYLPHFDGGAVRCRLMRGNESIAAGEATCESHLAAVSLSTEGLAAGPCCVEVDVLQPNGKLLRSRRLDYELPETPAWWGSDAGMSDFVPGPFEPIRREGRTLSLWGRRFGIGPDLVESIVSQGEELLAGSMRWIISEKGVGSRPSTVQINVSESGGAASIQAGDPEAQLSHAATLEYDGFFAATTRLTHEDEEQDACLVLEIPLRRECATLYARGDKGRADPVAPDENQERYAAEEAVGRPGGRAPAELA